MDRFVAMIWDRDNPSKLWQINSWAETLRRTSRNWTCVLDRPGLRVYCLSHRSAEPVVTRWDADRGVVIGRLFENDREQCGRVRRLDKDETDRILRSNGRNLISNFWGSYVAFWQSGTGADTYILRDPCGATPCFVMKVQGVGLLFSHANDVCDFQGVRFAIDWTYLKAFIAYDYFVTQNSGLADTKEVLAGERWHWRAQAESTQEFLWHPAHIAAAPSSLNFREASEQLRHLTRRCLTALGQEHANVVVRISGGLDSSALLCLLRQTSSARITGLHFLGVGYERHEAQLARIVAKSAGVELIERETDPRTDLRALLDMPRLARPTIQSLGLPADLLTTQVAETLNADCLMSGQGGDNLFLQRANAKQILSDYMQLHPLGGNTLRVAYDSATLRQESVLRTFVDALRVGLGEAWQPYAFLDRAELTRQRPFDADLLDDIPPSYKFHPWLAEAQRLPRGKAGHLLSILALQQYYPVQGHALLRDAVFPFVSQPIVEFSLRTPTFVLCQGGLDRSLEREAFKDLVPQEILRRTTKGVITSKQLLIMQHNLQFFRELILDGVLLRKGWAARDRVERLLTREHVLHGGGHVFIQLLAAAEIWLNTWRKHHVSVAA